MKRSFDLQRFVDAHDAAFQKAMCELRAGKKRTHWMWFVFPQIQGLGQSELSIKYSISGLDEGRAYLAHPILGPRLLECVKLVMQHGRAIEDVFGHPDDLKFHSSMTLFAAASSTTVNIL